MFSVKLKELRSGRGYLQRDISSHLEITREHYSKIERGIVLPSVLIIKKLSLFYDVSADYILGMINKPHALNIIEVDINEAI